MEIKQTAISYIKNMTTDEKRKIITDLVNGIPAECKYMVGAVGHNGSAYTLQVDIIKK